MWSRTALGTKALTSPLFTRISLTTVEEIEEYNVTATMPAVAASTKAVTSTATREKQ